MSSSRLVHRIAAAGLTPEAARTFADGLRAVAGQDLAEGSAKAALITRLMGAVAQAPDTAPLEALWPHAELFLQACVTVAVADGQYRVEEARAVSQLAHRLGFSARQLARLEEQLFADLQARGASRLPARPATVHDATALPEDDERTEQAARPVRPARA